MDDARYFDNGRLVVFRRQNIFQARTLLPNGRYAWRSLRTRDQELAINKAWKLHHTLAERCEQGLPITAKAFNAVIDDYVAFREKDCLQGRTKPAMLGQIKRVAKFWRAFAGTKPITALGDADLEAYVEWRRDYYANLGSSLPRNAKLHPADKTLQWEIMLGKAMIKWAHKKGLRGNKPVPMYSFTPRVKRVRPAFELAEYRRLWRVLWKRVRSCRNENWRESRELLRDYVLILANSGMRVGEANSLKLRDVIPFVDDAGRRTFRFLVDGKTGQREVIPRANAARFVRRVLERRAGAGANDLLFAMPNGGKINTLIDQFDAALREGGITHNSKGDKYTLYSLRHFYAVMGLRRGQDVFALARNMGTSVQMIQTYYGKQATAITFATKLGN